jgi:hypothetical protein
MSDDPHNRSAYCPILRETDKRKAAVSNNVARIGLDTLGRAQTLQPGIEER